MNLWIVDAFTTEPFSGNPAAVCLVTDFPTENVCLKISAEMNLSETAFVKPLGKGCFHIRWFTPKTEVKLCGHATLAASHILWQEKMILTNKIAFNSLSGNLLVTNDSEGITLNFPAQPPKQLTSIPNGIAEALGQTPINAALFGNDILLELNDATQVQNLEPNDILLKNLDYRGFIVTAKGKDTFDFISRFFAPKIGINEDPVTGSAHCKLAPYWAQKLNQKYFKAYQASARGGIMFIKLENDRVLMTGQAVTVLKGELTANLTHL